MALRVGQYTGVYVLCPGGYRVVSVDVLQSQYSLGMGKRLLSGRACQWGMAAARDSPLRGPTDGRAIGNSSPAGRSRRGIQSAARG